MDWLATIYPYVKWLHIAAVISWMAGLLYLPRLYVYHVEMADAAGKAMLEIMEARLYRAIMGPAMGVAWLLGLLMLITPGLIDFASVWIWIKMACVIVMSWYHYWLGNRRKALAAGTETRSGRTFRIMNEVPAVLMLVIVGMVVIRPF